MKKTKVITKRIVSPNGKVIAEAKSVVTVSEDCEGTYDQSVSVTVEENSSNSSSYSYSSSSSSSSSSSTY